MTVYTHDATLDERHKRARAYPEVASWLKRRELEGKAPRTLDGDERFTAALLRENLELELQEYTPEIIEDFLVRVTPNQRRKYRAHLAQFFDYAEMRDLIERSPMARVAKFKRPQQKIQATFQDADVQFLTSLGDPDGALYLILFDAGLRSGEARHLRVKDIDFARNVIGIHDAAKRGKHRVVPMTARLAGRLAALGILDALQPTDYLWYMRRGGHHRTHDRPIGETSIKSWHQRCCTKAGVSYEALHATRRTFATRALRSREAGGWGMSMPAVQRMLGHASIRTTVDEYAHLVTDDIAAELALVGVEV